jgi:hypothetical protein
MPAYRFFFTTRRIGAGPSADAVLLDDRDQPKAGMEVVPTADCQALVAYLLSLHKGYDLPDEHPGPVTMPKTEESP